MRRFAWLLAVACATCGDDTTTTMTAPPDMAWPFPPGPVSSDRAADVNGGGCYPAPLAGTGLSALLDELVQINPHWAPVLPTVPGAPDADVIVVHGVARGAHGDTGGDFPADHGAPDATTLVELDAADQRYLATGNGTLPDARLELEWESGIWPAWAWPGAGDRIVAMGRWIFDCGHPGSTPGRCSSTATQACILDSDCAMPACKGCAAGETCTGQHFAYSSEMHPPEATAVVREGRGAILSDNMTDAAVPATRVDVFVSGDGGAAGDRCVQTHQDYVTDVALMENCYPLSQPMNDPTRHDFVFDVPLPARPAGATAVWRWVAQAPAPSVAATATVEDRSGDATPHLTVRVLTTQKVGGVAATGFAATLLAGWQAAGQPALAHVRVTLDGLDVTNALKPAMPVVRAAPGWAM